MLRGGGACGAGVILRWGRLGANHLRGEGGARESELLPERGERSHAHNRFTVQVRGKYLNKKKQTRIVGPER